MENTLDTIKEQLDRIEAQNQRIIDILTRPAAMLSASEKGKKLGEAIRIYGGGSKEARAVMKQLF